MSPSGSSAASCSSRDCTRACAWLWHARAIGGGKTARTLKAIAGKVGLDAVAVDLHARWRYSRTRALRESNDRVFAAGAPDGLPLPPPYLAYQVSHDFDLQHYLENGALGVECIERALRDHGIDLGSLGSVLDWGCGCGRARSCRCSRTCPDAARDARQDLLLFRKG